MATVHKTSGHINVTGQCLICTLPSSAFWLETGGLLEVCPDCAHRVLPKLIVDANPIASRVF